MAKSLRHHKRSARRAVRLGRPPRELAGEVDGRILDAAHHVFLEQGFAGAGMEEIASRARASKPTVYTRFPSKELLFTAVVKRSIAATIARFEGHVPSGEKTEQRLASMGAAVLHWALAGDTVELMRVAISEAHRFPALANNVHLMLRDRGAEALARPLAQIVQSGALKPLPAFAPERLAGTTRLFQDVLVLPIIVRALFGEKLKSLRAEIEPHVVRSVEFFLAACRYDGIN